MDDLEAQLALACEERDAARTHRAIAERVANAAGGVIDALFQEMKRLRLILPGSPLAVMPAALHVMIRELVAARQMSADYAAALADVCEAHESAEAGLVEARAEIGRLRAHVAALEDIRTDLVAEANAARRALARVRRTR